MTIEEKARAYDEALNRCKEWASGTWGHSVDDSPKDIAEFIFPQLAESEDERIRRALIDGVRQIRCKNGVTQEQMLAYLEKQKDASKAIEAVDRIDKYIDEHVSNAHDMKDSNPDKKYYRGWDDALGKMAGILQDVYSVEKQKESLRDFIDDFPYSAEQDWNKKPCITCQEYEKGHKQGYTEGCTAGYNKAMKEMEQKESHYTKRNALFDKCVENCDPKVMKKVSDEIDEMLQKEQKPFNVCEQCKCPDYNEQKSTECIDFDNEFENQISHLIASILNSEHEYNEGFIKYAAQSLLEYAKNEMKPDEWDKREKLFTKALQTANAQIGQLFEENKKLKEQQPTEIDEYKIIKKHITEDSLSSEVNKRLKECGWYVTDTESSEWSEEDEGRLINTSISFLKDFADKGYENAVECIDWLKSLRPSWKPTKEQMDALRDVIETVPMTCRQQVPLESLYLDLNKNL